MQEQYSHDLEKAKHGKDTVFVCSFYYIDDFLSAFHTFDGSIGVTSIATGGNNIFDKWPGLLRHGACDLVFANDLVDKENEYTIIPFDTDYYVAVLPASHRFAGRKSLPLSALSGENFISLKETHSDRYLKELCRKSGFDPKIAFNSDTGSAIASFVRDGMGVSILLKKTLSKMNVHGVALVDLEPETKMNVCICYPKAAQLSKGAKKLVQFAEENWPGMKGKKQG
jgi:DNA-binding transcriptional LysR family regulator